MRGGQATPRRRCGSGTASLRRTGPVDLLPCDADLAADLRILLRTRGRQLELPDALIAGVALRLDFTLLTADADFAAVPGLRTEDWQTP